MFSLLAPLLLLSTTASSFDSMDNASLLADAEAAYRRGLEASEQPRIARAAFLESAERYGLLWNRGRREPGLARNLAQAYLLAGDIGRAIRWYRRGLLLSPSDPELNEGLRYARAHVLFPLAGLPSEELRPHEDDSFLQSFSSTQWYLIVAGLAAFAWLSLAVSWLKRSWFWLSAWALGLVAAIGLAAIISARQEQLQREFDEGAILLSPTLLRTGNAYSYPAKWEVPLPAGLEMHETARRGGWVQVRLANGNLGWFPEDRVIRLSEEWGVGSGE